MSTQFLLVAPPGPDRLLAAMLETKQMEAVLGRCRILEAHATDEGLQRLAKSAMDACIVDGSFPAALHFVQRARASGFRKPILLAVSHAGLDTRASALAAGATDVLPKAGISTAALGLAIQGAILRGRFEDSLARSQEGFRQAFHASPVGNSITVLSGGRFSDVNEAFCRIAGRSRADIIGKSGLELGLIPDGATRRSLADLLQAEGGYRNREVTLARPDGRRVHALVSAQLLDLAGRPSVFATMVDVTAERQNAEMLRRREVQLADAEQLARMGSWEWCPATKEIQWSPNLRAMTGITADERLGLAAYLRHVHDDDRGAVRAAFDRLLVEDGPIEQVHRLLRADGSELTVRGRVRAHVNSVGMRRLLGIVQELPRNP